MPFEFVYKHLVISQPRIIITQYGFKSISLPFLGDFSTFPYGTLYAIGLDEYFVFGNSVPVFSCENFNPHYSGAFLLFSFCINETFTLFGVFFQTLNTLKKLFFKYPLHHTII